MTIFSLPLSTAFFAIALAAPASAQTAGVAVASLVLAQAGDGGNTTSRLDALGLASVCSFVGSRMKDEDESSPWTYVYQTKIYKAAGVADPKEAGDAASNARITTLWTELLQHVTCDNSTFNVRNGSLLKYAVSAHFDSFIFEATRKWKIPLNNVDQSDGRTVLDYVADELKIAANSSLREKLEKYYRQLRAAGAKHRRELP